MATGLLVALAQSCVAQTVRAGRDWIAAFDLAVKMSFKLKLKLPAKKAEPKPTQ